MLFYHPLRWGLKKQKAFVSVSWSNRSNGLEQCHQSARHHMHQEHSIIMTHQTVSLKIGRQVQLHHMQPALEIAALHAMRRPFTA